MVAVTSVNELTEMWNKDCVVDPLEIVEASSKTPRLHAKYLEIRTRHSLRQEDAELERKRLIALKYLYYRGDLNDRKDILEKEGWEPNTVSIPKGAVEIMVNADPDLLKVRTQELANKAIVDFCNEVLKELHNRTWQLKTMQDSKKLDAGG